VYVKASTPRNALCIKTSEKSIRSRLATIENVQERN
jgi:hypothetical protein